MAGHHGAQIQNKRSELVEKKVNDMQEEHQRIQQAQKSLEIEKVIQKMKKDSYRNDLDQLMMYKNEQVNPNQYAKNEIEKRQDISNIQQYAQNEFNPMAAYKNKFVAKDQVMSYRQGQY